MCHFLCNRICMVAKNSLAVKVGMSEFDPSQKASRGKGWSRGRQRIRSAATPPMRLWVHGLGDHQDVGVVAVELFH